MKTLVKKILKTTLTSLKGYVQFKQNSWDKKSKKVRLKKMEKVSLKTNYFQFWVDWDQLLFCDFWDFFRRCKKTRKKFVYPLPSDTVFNNYRHMKPSVEKRDFGENPWVLTHLPCKKLGVSELRNETFRDWEWSIMIK